MQDFSSSPDIALDECSIADSGFNSMDTENGEVVVVEGVDKNNEEPVYQVVQTSGNFDDINDEHSSSHNNGEGDEEKIQQGNILYVSGQNKMFCCHHNGYPFNGYCLEHKVLTCKDCPCYKNGHNIIDINDFQLKYGCIQPKNGADLMEIEGSIIGAAGMVAVGENPDNERNAKIQEEYTNCLDLMKSQGPEIILRKLKERCRRAGATSTYIENTLNRIEACRPGNQDIMKCVDECRELCDKLDALAKTMEKKRDLMERYKFIYDDYQKISVQQETNHMKHFLGQALGLVQNAANDPVDGKLAQATRQFMRLVYRVSQVLSGDINYIKTMTRTHDFCSFIGAQNVKFVENLEGADVVGNNHANRERTELLVSTPLRVKIPTGGAREIVAAISPLGFLVQASDNLEIRVTDFNRVKENGEFVTQKWNVPFYITSIGFYKDRIIYSVKNNHIYSADFFSFLINGELDCDKNGNLLTPFNEIVDWCDMTHLATEHIIPFGDENGMLRILDVETRTVTKPLIDGSQIHCSYTISTTGLKVPDIDFVLVYEKDIIHRDNQNFEIKAIKRVEKGNNTNFVLVHKWESRSVPMYLFPKDEVDNDDELDLKESHIITYRPGEFISLYGDEIETVIHPDISLYPEQALVRVYKDVFLFFGAVRNNTRKPHWYAMRITSSFNQ